MYLIGDGAQLPISNTSWYLAYAQNIKWDGHQLTTVFQIVSNIMWNLASLLMFLNYGVCITM